jgi:uncharacterized membrane protein YfcA
VTLAFAATLVALGVVGAFVSGLVGVGGAIVMIPLLLYVPPALGVGHLDVKEVAGVTMAQVFVAAVSGMLAHRRHQAVNAELAWFGGLLAAAGSFTGALASKYIDANMVLLVFALMATGAAMLMILPMPISDFGAPAARRFSRARVAPIAGGVGLAAGVVGAGGAFLLVPLLTVVVRVPLRVTIGSSLAITALSATAGFVGKALTGQIPWLAALVVAVGAVPGAQIGAAVSQRLAGGWLRLVLFAIIVSTAVRVWWDVLSG